MVSPRRTRPMDLQVGLVVRRCEFSARTCRSSSTSPSSSSCSRTSTRRRRPARARTRARGQGRRRAGRRRVRRRRRLMTTRVSGLFRGLSAFAPRAMSKSRRRTRRARTYDAERRAATADPTARSAPSRTTTSWRPPRWILNVRRGRRGHAPPPPAATRLENVALRTAVHVDAKLAEEARAATASSSPSQVTSSASSTRPGRIVVMTSNHPELRPRVLVFRLCRRVNLKLNLAVRASRCCPEATRLVDEA